MSFEADICFNLFGKENMEKRASKLVCILLCAVKDTVCTCGVKREIESKGIWNSVNEGKRYNMYVGSNVCKYVICQETVLEGSFSYLGDVWVKSSGF